MNNRKNVLREVISITYLLMACNLSVIQNFPIEKTNIDGTISVEWNNIKNLSISLKNISYIDIYNELDKNRDYNIKLIDGALIHMMYRFKDNELLSHRLAFYPSPYLESYQNDPEIYELDEIYADIVYKNIVAFPIRFDYNKDLIDGEFHHPKSHATLGQYKNCRIPVYGPMAPRTFIEFIFKNFYSKAFYKYLNTKLPDYCCSFNTIEKAETSELHFNLSYH